MKSWILFATVAAAGWAQAPARTPIPPETVVATVDGKGLTYGELRQILEASPPALLQYFRQNPEDAIERVFLFRHLTEEADKLKLAEESPWKEQIEAQRENILGTAMLSHMANSYPASEEQVRAYYDAHKERFERVKLKIIKIGFQPGAQPAAASGTSSEALADAARKTVEAAHNPIRAEADAARLASDLVKKLRAGADFSKIAAEYSDDEESKKKGGDFGALTPASAAPDSLKKAALAMKPGDVTEPIKVSVAFYILRCDEKSAQPLSEVHEQVLRDVRQEHVNEAIAQLEKRFKPAIVKPDALVQLGK